MDEHHCLQLPTVTRVLGARASAFGAKTLQWTMITEPLKKVLDIKVIFFSLAKSAVLKMYGTGPRRTPAKRRNVKSTQKLNARSYHFSCSSDERMMNWFFWVAFNIGRPLLGKVRNAGYLAGDSSVIYYFC